MALDVGDVRIGIAVSDLMGIIANPLETYTRKGDIQNDARYIIDLANSKDVSLFVSGLPLGLDGKENEQTRKTREFIGVLIGMCDIPVKFFRRTFYNLICRKSFDTRKRPPRKQKESNRQGCGDNYIAKLFG